MNSFFEFIKSNAKEVKSIKEIIVICYSVIFLIIIVSLTSYKWSHPEVPFEAINQNLIFSFSMFSVFLYAICYICIKLITLFFDLISCRRVKNDNIEKKSFTHLLSLVFVILMFGTNDYLRDWALIKSGVVRNNVEIKVKDIFKERIELISSKKEYSCIKLQSIFKVDIIYSNDKSIFIKCADHPESVEKPSLELSKDEVFIGI